MKRYYNLAFQAVILLPITSVFYLLFIIMGSIFFREPVLDFVAMCITFTCVIAMIWFALYFLRDYFIITYFDERKIYQKNLWRKKSIYYKNIEEIYIVESYIYLTSKCYSFKEQHLSRKSQKILKKEIVIMIGNDAEFLKYISLNEIDVHIYKNRLPNTIKKYLN